MIQDVTNYSSSVFFAIVFILTQKISMILSVCAALPIIMEIRSTSSYILQRWSDSVFLLSDPILFLKNDIRIRSESCFGWNHTFRIRILSESVLWSTTYIFVLCLFCLMRKNNFGVIISVGNPTVPEAVRAGVWEGLVNGSHTANAPLLICSPVTILRKPCNKQTCLTY